MKTDPKTEYSAVGEILDMPCPGCGQDKCECEEKEYDGGLRSAIVILAILFSVPAQALEMNMEAIKQIESSGNPLAHNKADDSRGLYQITPIVLKEWNAFHPTERLAPTDLWSPAVNFKVGNWYMNDRCPSMIKHYGKPDNVENRIICYNAGISYVKNGKPIPKTTKRYITKYAALTAKEQ